MSLPSMYTGVEKTPTVGAQSLFVIKYLMTNHLANSLLLFSYKLLNTKRPQGTSVYWLIGKWKKI